MVLSTFKFLHETHTYNWDWTKLTCKSYLTDHMAAIKAKDSSSHCSEFSRSVWWRHNGVTLFFIVSQQPPLQEHFHATGRNANAVLCRQNFMNEDLSRKTRDTCCDVTASTAPAILLVEGIVNTINMWHRDFSFVCDLFTTRENNEDTWGVENNVCTWRGSTCKEIWIQGIELKQNLLSHSTYSNPTDLMSLMSYLGNINL